MKLKTSDGARKLSTETAARIKKYSGKHQSSLSKWEKDVKFATGAVTHARSLMKKGEAKINAADKLLAKVWPKFEEAKKEYEAAKKGGEKKKVAEAEKTLKKWDDAAHNAALMSAEGHGLYWGGVNSSMMYANELSLKLDVYT